MHTLRLTPNHKTVQEYYTALERYAQQHTRRETTVRNAFIPLLELGARQFNWTLLLEYPIRTSDNRRIVIDGALLDTSRIPRGFYEAKDDDDELTAEIDRKFGDGYPQSNILFQTPTRAVLYQNGQLVITADLTDAAQLVLILKRFFEYKQADIADWENAVDEFKTQVPALGRGLAKLIQTQQKRDRQFRQAFVAFHEECRALINPNLTEAAVEEMLIQHILTERIFSTVFHNRDFTRRNIIAREIENVIDALTRQAFNRDAFLQSLDGFYTAIEKTAATLTDFSQKQGFLNAVYEQFFQGFSVEVADTHGIVYTPQAVVNFMVESVEQILKTEFGRSLADKGVHIIDAFVGTGNFIVRIMQALDKIALEEKYEANPPELHCNEVMLLPYYIASLNIEHEFYEAIGRYVPFQGICLVDTFDLAETRQSMLFSQANSQRVENQKTAPMFVVIGNPPYNAAQSNDSDRNPNRKYEVMDKQVRDTYVADSSATNKSSLYDPYIKSLRWASDRVGKEGIVAVVTNNNFIDAIAADGMRKHLAADFSKILHINLKGNARTSGERRRKEGGNIFDDQVRVGVGISFFIKKADASEKPAEVWIYDIDDYLKAREKQQCLAQFGDYTQVPMKRVTVDAKHTWRTEGLRTDFETFMPLGSKAAKQGKTEETLFRKFTRAVGTSRDAWACNFNRRVLAENMEQTIRFYNHQVFAWQQQTTPSAKVEDFVAYDDTKISWSHSLKTHLQRGTVAEFAESKITESLYRPFTKTYLFFDRVMNNEGALFSSIFPTPESSDENRVLCVSGIGNKSPFTVLMTKMIPGLGILGGDQCFPFYLYDEDGTNRRENITEWALAQYRAHYDDETITKWDIFHYLYGVLHHPGYRETYQANLRRDLPHIPFAPDFWTFAEAGAQLAELHLNYELLEEHQSLRVVANPSVPLNWRVGERKMRFSKDKTALHYNESLTIEGIPAETFDYRLGTRSAVEWVVERYRVTTDKRSGIVNDPNCADDAKAIVRLIGQVVSVSVKTVEIVARMSEAASFN